MKYYLYEAVISPSGDGRFDVSFPDLGVITMGDDLYDAALMGKDLLKMTITSKLRDGEDVPDPVMGREAPEGGYTMIIAVDAEDSSATVDTMTVQEAADVFDVSRSRIYAMIHNGQLRAEKVGNQRLVSAAM